MRRIQAEEGKKLTAAGMVVESSEGFCGASASSLGSTVLARRDSSICLDYKNNSIKTSESTHSTMFRRFDFDFFDGRLRRRFCRRLSRRCTPEKALFGRRLIGGYGGLIGDGIGYKVR